MFFGKKKLGFGLMRLPKTEDGAIDYAQVNTMVDSLMAQGFNYFDTAHGYEKGESEKVVKKCIAERYPREDFLLTDKLTEEYFKTEEDIRPLIEEQLELCGVDYFDILLMHNQNHKTYQHFQECHAYEQALKLKEAGLIKHFGFSFHDKAEMLEEILTDHPEVEVVQIQLNYLDYEDPAVQSRKCLEVCRKHGKPVIVMEPVKGGSLVKLPEEGQKVLDQLQGGSNASYAIRFAASCEGVELVLSGMSSFEQMQDNTSYMADFKPLTEKELVAIASVCDSFKKVGLIACTACRYCVDGCPMAIAIPDLFACMNAKEAFHDWNQDYYYELHTSNGAGRAKDCIMCGKCEHECPQNLPIRALLKKVSASFDQAN